MKSKPSFVRVLILLGVLFFQLVLIQGALFVVSYLLMIFGGYGQTGKIMDALVLGISFSAGSFLAGWIALKFHWLDAETKYATRAVGTLLGAFIPLLAAVLIYPRLEPGNPFYAVSILFSILGFHIPSWIKGDWNKK
jgi:hypothetical protein